MARTLSRSSQNRQSTVPPVLRHDDPGLQPERTTLAWGRTVMAFMTAAAVCLRWVSHHGIFVLTLFGVAVLTGTAIYLTQRTRYARGSRGIAEEQVRADATGVLSLCSATVLLGVLGISVVLMLA